MEDYQLKTLEELIDFLSLKTKQYNELLLKNSEDILKGKLVDGYATIKDEIRALRDEIQKRNAQKSANG